MNIIIFGRKLELKVGQKITLLISGVIVEIPRTNDCNQVEY